MSTSTRVTYEQFEEMGLRGDFDHTDDRHELLLGEIVKMTLPKPIHDHIVELLNEWSFEELAATSRLGSGTASPGHPRTR